MRSPSPRRYRSALRTRRGAGGSGMASAVKSTGRGRACSAPASRNGPGASEESSAAISNASWPRLSGGSHAVASPGTPTKGERLANTVRSVARSAAMTRLAGSTRPPASRSMGMPKPDWKLGNRETCTGRRPRSSSSTATSPRFRSASAPITRPVVSSAPNAPVAVVSSAPNAAVAVVSFLPNAAVAVVSAGAPGDGAGASRQAAAPSTRSALRRMTHQPRIPAEPRDRKPPYHGEDGGVGRDVLERGERAHDERRARRPEGDSLRQVREEVIGGGAEESKGAEERRARRGRIGGAPGEHAARQAAHRPEQRRPEKLPREHPRVRRAVGIRDAEDQTRRQAHPDAPPHAHEHPRQEDR